MRQLIALLLTFGLATPVAAQNSPPEVVEPYAAEPRYLLDGATVVYQDAGGRRVIAADVASFHVVSQPFIEGPLATDRNAVYLRGVRVAGSPAGATLLSGPFEYRDNANSKPLYWKSASGVFLGTTPIDGADPASFVVLGSGYFGDRARVYHGTKPVEHADRATFVVEGKLAYDKRWVYAAGKIALHEGERLQPVNERLAKTSRHVVSAQYPEDRLDHIDAATVRGLARHYAVDRGHVYYDDAVVVGIEPANFKRLRAWGHDNSDYVTDGLRVYRNDKPTGTYGGRAYDATSFGVLPESDLPFDHTGVYLFDERLPFNATKPFRLHDALYDNERYQLFWAGEMYDSRRRVVVPGVSPSMAEAYPYLRGRDGIYYNDFDHLLLAGRHGVELIGLPLMGFTRQFVRIDDGVFYGGERVVVADPRTFEQVRHFGLLTAWYRDSVAVYQSNEGKLTPLVGVTPRTFRVLSVDLATDGKRLFVGPTVVDGFSGDGLRVLAVFAGHSGMMRCSQDTTSPRASVTIAVQTSAGYWEVDTSAPLSVRAIGAELPADYFDTVKSPAR